MTDDLDPIGELSHDHSALSALLLAVRDVLQRSGIGVEPHDAVELRDGVEALRDEMLLHFAKEEEALLPFVIERFASMRQRAEALRTDHEAVCRSAEELLRASERALAASQALADCRASLRALEELYTKHTQSELALLRDVDELLDEGARAQLRTLVRTA